MAVRVGNYINITFLNRSNKNNKTEGTDYELLQYFIGSRAPHGF